MGSQSLMVVVTKNKLASVINVLLRLPIGVKVSGEDT